jgi:hypothetical protein
MARVYLTSTDSTAIAGNWWRNYSRLKKSALASNTREHQLVEAPEQADIILFTDAQSDTQADIRTHDLTTRFRDRVFVYSTFAHNIPIVPGIYTCAERRWYLPSHMRAGFYVKVFDHDWIQPSSIESEARYLFSFCGSFDTHPLRKRIASLAGPRGFVRDTSQDEGRGFGKSAETYQQWAATYFQTIREAMFVLCPRGVAPSSYRIFEAMKAGRVPVIVADAWVPPVGPDWPEFSVQIPEKRLEEVPDLLERMAGRAPDMGLRARQAWERWFSAEQAFQTVATWCLQIKEARRNQWLLGNYRPFLELARPIFLRHVLLPAAKRKLRVFGKSSG